MAPEVLHSKPYTDMVDTWSVGVILYELLTLERPFKAASIEELTALVTEEAPHHPRHVPSQRPPRPLRVPCASPARPSRPIHPSPQPCSPISLAPPPDLYWRGPLAGWAHVVGPAQLCG